MSVYFLFWENPENSQHILIFIFLKQQLDKLFHIKKLCKLFKIDILSVIYINIYNINKSNGQ